MQTASPASEYVITEVQRWIRRNPPTTTVPANIVPGEFHDRVVGNRLAALMNLRFAVEEPTAAWAPVLKQFEHAYHANIMHAFRNLRAAAEATGTLERAGVSCLWLRGPFAGAGLYNDPGARCFSDLDLLVPAAQRENAFEVLASMGYRMPGFSLSRRFFAKHHLHWRLESPHGIVCELHWSLDHPYKLHRVDYDAVFREARPRTADKFSWSEPGPDHLLLAACMHLAKHCRLPPGSTENPGFPVAIVGRGWLTHWLDVLMILRRHGASLDWDRILATADSWFVRESLSSGLLGAARILDGLVPPEVIARIRGSERLVVGAVQKVVSTAASAKAGILDRVLAPAGCHSACLSDWRAFVFPSSRHFAGSSGINRIRRRFVHAVFAVGRLGMAAVEMAWYRAVQVARRALSETGSGSDVRGRQA